MTGTTEPPDAPPADMPGPAAEINILQRQLAAAKIIIGGLERIAIEHGAERRALAAAAADVAGERAANEVLTAEIDRLTKYAAHCASLIAAYKDVTARDNSRVTPLPRDPKNQHAINVAGFGWVAVKAVRAIERAHGIGRCHTSLRFRSGDEQR